MTADLVVNCIVSSLFVIMIMFLTVAMFITIGNIAQERKLKRDSKNLKVGDMFVEHCEIPDDPFTKRSFYYHTITDVLTNYKGEVWIKTKLFHHIEPYLPVDHVKNIFENADEYGWYKDSLYVYQVVETGSSNAISFLNRGYIKLEK